jgi:hypothetical protein
MRATVLRSRGFARALVLGALVIAAGVASAAPAVASAPTTLGVSGWQVYATTHIYANPDSVQIHGDPGEYLAAPAIPAQDDAGWADCGPSSPSRYSPYGGTNPLCPSASTIGMAVGSILPGCWSGLNFSYFQALVSIPANTTISNFSVNMSGADDGARISLVNSQYPNGVTPSAGYIYQLTQQSTGNLASDVVAGEVNRVIITQVDDCAVGNNLNSAQIFLNGRVIPPVPTDSTAPADNPVVTPAANANGWNNSDATVNWNWTDNGSGIDPSNCTQSTTSTGEGSITLSSTCQDNAGNSASDSVSVNVDTTAPTVTYSGNEGSYTVADTISITCSASDALSGLATSTCANVDGPAWTLALGQHSYSATATDAAGNTGSGSTAFTVTVGFDSLCSLVEQFSTKAGIAHSLCAKLAAAGADAARGQLKAKSNVLDAFAQEVDAQSGKAFTAAHAALLVRFAATL